MKRVILFLLLLIGVTMSTYAATSTPTPIYVYGAPDLFVNETVTISNETGTYTYTNLWGTDIMVAVYIFDIEPLWSSDAYQATVDHDVDDIIVTIRDTAGDAIDARGSTITISVLVYRKQTDFPWW